jgi:hypothetical protein
LVNSRRRSPTRIFAGCPCSVGSSTHTGMSPGSAVPGRPQTTTWGRTARISFPVARPGYRWPPRRAGASLGCRRR